MFPVACNNWPFVIEKHDIQRRRKEVERSVKSFFSSSFFVLFFFNIVSQTLSFILLFLLNDIGHGVVTIDCSDEYRHFLAAF